MWHPAETKVNEQKPAAGSASSKAAIGLGAATEQATLGATITVKGEVSGSQALYVDGRVEGSIRFPEHRVTIGRTAVVLANIEAKELVIMGTVTGNIDCSDRVDIRSDAALTGDVVTRRISIDEGALVKGSVEVWRGRVREHAAPEVPAETAGATTVESVVKAEGQTKSQMPGSTATVASPTEAPKAAAAAATGSRSVSRVAGSSVLYQEPKGGTR